MGGVPPRVRTLHERAFDRLGEEPQQSDSEEFRRAKIAVAHALRIGVLEYGFKTRDWDGHIDLHMRSFDIGEMKGIMTVAERKEFAAMRASLRAGYSRICDAYKAIIDRRRDEYLRTPNAEERITSGARVGESWLVSTKYFENNA